MKREGKFRVSHPLSLNLIEFLLDTWKCYFRLEAFVGACGFAPLDGSRFQSPRPLRAA